MTKEEQLQQALEEHRQAKNKLLDRVHTLPKLIKERDACWTDVLAIVRDAVERLAKGEAKETWLEDLQTVLANKVLDHTLGDLRGLIEKL